MPRSKVIPLAGQDYEVSQLAMKPNKEWRERITEPVNKVISLIQNYKDLEINSAADLAGLIVVVKDVLFGSMDLLLDAMFDYSPALAADRERIEAEAYDDEAIAAIISIADLAFPFARLVTAWGGLSGIQTSTSLPTPNGVSGKKRLVGQKTT